MVEIISVKKNYIKYKMKSSGQVQNLIVCFLLFFALTLSYSYIKYFSGKNQNSYYQNIVTVCNPVGNLYSDMTNSIFTSANIKNDELKFFIPIKGINHSINGGEITFEVGQNIMIYSMENGIVIDTYLNVLNKKCIKIQHNKNVYSVIENIDVLGVVKNQTVKKGQEIATAKTGEKLIAKIYQNNNVITSLNIVKNEIICEI